MTLFSYAGKKARRVNLVRSTVGEVTLPSHCCLNRGPAKTLKQAMTRGVLTTGTIERTKKAITICAEIRVVISPELSKEAALEQLKTLVRAIEGHDSGFSARDEKSE